MVFAVKFSKNISRMSFDEVRNCTYFFAPTITVVGTSTTG